MSLTLHSHENKKKLKLFQTCSLLVWYMQVKDLIKDVSKMKSLQNWTNP